MLLRRRYVRLYWRLSLYSLSLSLYFTRTLSLSLSLSLVRYHTNAAFL